MQWNLPSEEQLRARAHAALATWAAEAELPDLQIVWQATLRTTAGRAELRQRRILLNPHLLARAPAQIEQVLVHEVAHLVTWARHGRRARPHGPEWAALMEQAGLPADARHRIPAHGLRRQRYWYLHLCRSCGVRSIRRRALRLFCGGCRGRGEMLRLRAPGTQDGYDTLVRLALEDALRYASPGAGHRR
jgi:SprT protein